jgi:hypothetical protein
MIANALLATTVICLGLLFWLLDTCRFLIPYRAVLIEEYGRALVLWAAVLFLNVFAGVYVLGRTVFLKDTGQKLAHLEKQLRTGERVSAELSRRLEE